jgi:hypothetical protein
MNCLNCGKDSGQERICKSCMDTMPAHIKPFATEEIFKLIHTIAEEKEQGK